jgi:uncharacterized protein YdaU (DUF1376 family)
MKEKIYFFQERCNDILDLQHELNYEEIGIYFVLKATYFKHLGSVNFSDIARKSGFTGSKKKLLKVVEKVFFKAGDGMLINEAWLKEVEQIKRRSESRKLASLARWHKQESHEAVKNCDAVKNEFENESDEKFDTFWKNYIPVRVSSGKIVNKGDKIIARRVFNKIIGKHTLEEILEGLERYLADCKKNNILSCGASVFLNQKRFLREIQENVVIGKNFTFNKNNEHNKKILQQFLND